MSSPTISLAKRHLMAWGTGRDDLVPGAVADGGTATVVLEDATHLEQVLASDLTGRGTVVLAPGARTRCVDGPDDGVRVIGYDGSAREPGGDLSIEDEFFLQVQDYATSQYMSVIGATLVRVTGEEDFATFLADADHARETGDFPAFLTSPAVQLADLASLGGSRPEGGPSTRLTVDAAGAVSTSVGGSALGTLGQDDVCGITRRWREINAASDRPCAVALRGVLREEVRSGGLSARPWLAQYLAAVEALRELQARGVPSARVSGFGGLLTMQEDVDGRSPEAGRVTPLLLRTGDDHYLHGPSVSKTFRVTAAMAALIEHVLVHGPVEPVDGDDEAVRAAARLCAAAGVPLTATEVPVGVGT